MTSRWETIDGNPILVLQSDKPAFFVTATTGIPGFFSDNAVTLIPGRETRLGFTPRHGAKAEQKSLAAGLRIQHLTSTALPG